VSIINNMEEDRECLINTLVKLAELYPEQCSRIMSLLVPNTVQTDKRMTKDFYKVGNPRNNIVWQ